MIELLRSNTPRSLSILIIAFVSLALAYSISQGIFNWKILFGLGILFAISLLFNTLVHEHQMLSERTYLSSLLLLYIAPKDFSSTGLLELGSLLLCLYLLYLVYHFQDGKISDRKLFDTGFIAGLSIMLNPFSAPILIFPALGMLYYARLRFRLVILYLTSASLPLLFLLEINYLSDANYLIQQWPGFLSSDIEFSSPFLWTSVLFVATLILGFLAFLRTMAKSKVSIRSGIRMLLLFSVLGFFALFQGAASYSSSFLFLSIPLAWYLTNFLLAIRRAWLSNLLLIAVLVFLNYRDLFMGV